MFAGIMECRHRNGYPGYNEIMRWLDTSIRPPYPAQKGEKMLKKELADIPTLDNYSKPPDESFWSSFPTRQLPKKPETVINVDNLEIAINEAAGVMTKSELRRARRVVYDLKNGADAYQKTKLPPCSVKNAASAFNYGELMTDKIGTWIKKGFVSGPFITPPMAGFRANPLMAVARNRKVRPVLNMSGPKGRSFNDNIVQEKLEKVHMATAKAFSFALRKAGKNSRMSKFDICDAYKLIPAKIEDLRLQGFSWLGRHFCETQGTFGGIGSVCNFDRLGNTKDTLVCLRSETPMSSVFRILDDSPQVAPECSETSFRFAKEMRSFCKFINLPLAENCVNNDKAFELQTRGIVLGIGFDSSDLSWFLPQEKADKVITRCLDTCNASHVDLKQTQKLMGSVNDLSQLCPFLRFHRGHGNRFLAKFENNENILLMVPGDMKQDLLVAAKVAEKATQGLPIAAEPSKPPLSCLVMYTDAAGASFSKCKGDIVFHDQGFRGVACIAGESMDDIWAWCRLTWPIKFLTQMRDQRGIFFGCKSTTLECIGLLLPLVAFPELLVGRHICFRVDNIAVYYGWYSGHIKYDSSASEILKCVHYMAAHLGATIHVEHVPRMSCEMAALADEMSRKRYSSEFRALSRIREYSVSGVLLTWFSNPTASDFCARLMRELQGKFPY